MSKVVLRNLVCQLTEAEVNDRARRGAQLTKDVDDAEHHLEREKERAKNSVKEAEAIVAGKKAELNSNARVVREREEHRPVECEELWRRAEHKVYVTRLDTGEVVEKRSISDDDARKGAEWSLDHHAGRATLRHPDEPGVVLDSRPLTDDEKQVEIPGTEAPDAKKKRAAKPNGAGAGGDEASAK